MNIKKSILALALGTVMTLGTLGQAVAVEPIKVGTFLAVTGPASFLGDPELKTLQMYIENINAKGGIDGRQVELV
ncbi:ABC transporter substrate-binding protein, partial [Sedimenticola sp.]|uniref:ABC transporter substrate-binding protein n=1 Tax=Sedimenticola sp. TaxID=1940285 RepID=UPI003D10274B